MAEAVAVAAEAAAEAAEQENDEDDNENGSERHGSGSLYRAEFNWAAPYSDTLSAKLASGHPLPAPAPADAQRRRDGMLAARILREQEARPAGNVIG